MGDRMVAGLRAQLGEAAPVLATGHLARPLAVSAPPAVLTWVACAALALAGLRSALRGRLGRVRLAELVVDGIE